MSEVILKCTSLQKNYEQEIIFKDFSFEVKKGEIVAIIGKSGIGKSTLLRIISTLDREYIGNIFIDGINIKSLKGKDLALFRNKKIGIVFQDNNLLPEFNSLENICIPGYIFGKKKEVDLIGEKLLNDLEIINCKNKFPYQISGGQAQRVAIARALINSPCIVFADEPTGNLDESSAQNIHEIILNLRKKYTQTFVIVTHNKGLMSIADKIVEVK